MTIVADAPRGGYKDQLKGELHTFLLRNAEIELFEDRHRGIFELWDGFFGGASKPTSRELKDILALGLVGAGMEAAKADRIIKALGPGDLLAVYQIAQAVLGVAFMPDAADEGDDEKKEPAPKSSDGT